MAKLHVRYMVGGRVRGLRDELIYRFQFPERPGALLKFLDGLGDATGTSACSTTATTAPTTAACWPASRCPKPTAPASGAALDELGYPYWAETGNPAYRLYLDGNAPAGDSS